MRSWDGLNAGGRPWLIHTQASIVANLATVLRHPLFCLGTLQRTQRVFNRSPDVGVAQLRIPFRRRFAEDLLRPSRAELALHARVQAVVRPGQRLAQLGLCPGRATNSRTCLNNRKSCHLVGTGSTRSSLTPPRGRKLARHHHGCFRSRRCFLGGPCICDCRPRSLPSPLPKRGLCPDAAGPIQWKPSVDAVSRHLA